MNLFTALTENRRFALFAVLKTEKERTKPLFFFSVAMVALSFPSLKLIIKKNVFVPLPVFP